MKLVSQQVQTCPEWACMFLEEGELMVSNKTKISIACLSFGIELGFFFMSNYLHLCKVQKKKKNKKLQPLWQASVMERESISFTLSLVNKHLRIFFSNKRRMENLYPGPNVHTPN